MLSTLALAFLALLQPADAPAPPDQTPAPQGDAAPKSGGFYTTVDHVRLKIDLPAVKFFTAPERRDLLLRYLEASPKWRVGIERGSKGDRIVVYRRDAGRTTFNGFVTDPGVPNSARQTRVGFVFADEPVDRALSAPCATTLAPDAGEVDVAICSYKLIPSQRTANLFIGSSGAWLAPVLIDREGKLSGMDAMLRSVEDELAEVRTIAEAGDVQKVIDAASSKTATPSLIVNDEDAQTLQVTAWVNPGEPGVTGIRVKRASDAEYLKISHPHLYIRERIGFSADQSRVFFAESNIIIRDTATGWNTTHDLIFELWFKPDAGGEAVVERKLIEKRQTVAGWEN